MSKPRDNAMRNDTYNDGRTHFPGVRCGVVTSQLTEKNIRGIVFVTFGSRLETACAHGRCTFLDRDRRPYVIDPQCVASFFASLRQRLDDGISLDSRRRDNRAAGLLQTMRIRRREAIPACQVLGATGVFRSTNAAQPRSRVAQI
jgi:hypothetical protein